MPTQRIFATALLTVIGLLAAGMLLNSPYQVWLLMAGIGAITGISYPIGQRHVITGFGIGISLTLVREAIVYGEMVKAIAPVYFAGYLFAIATSLAIRYTLLKFRRSEART